MAEITTGEIREYLRRIQGQEVSLGDIRNELQVEKGTKSFDAVRNIMFELAAQKVIKRVGRSRKFKVVKEVSPIKVFGQGRTRKPPFDLIFPRDFETGVEFPFAEHVVIREGDMVLVAGFSNFGKTTLVLNFAGENIDKCPVLMGNEYIKDNEPSPRFYNRLTAMSHIEWTNGDGSDKFTLLPVYDDYAEHIVRDRINIIDWINLPGEYYMISPVMEGIKREIGNGIAIIVLQKNEDATLGRGGNPSRDFADLELLIDKHTDFESRLTVGKTKETTKHISGKSWAYEISNQGTQITNVREVVKCYTCHGFKYIKGKGKCDTCNAIGWINK